MVAEQQFRETLHRIVEALNTRDWDALDGLLDETVATDYVGHVPGVQGPVRGREGLKQWFRFAESWPDYRGTIEDVFVAGDKAAARMTSQRTDPVTGKTQHVSVILISHLKGGKFSEDWEVAGPWEDEA